MPDEITPDQQAAPDNQETLDQQAQVQPDVQTVDWEARYKGSVAKIEQLTKAQRDLQTQLGAKSSEAEQLSAQLGIKDTEKDVAIRERDKRLDEEMQRAKELAAQNEQLLAFKLKADIANELGMPELMAIAEHIPNLTDKEALTVVMKDFGAFTNDQVVKREKQILAGVNISTGAQHAEPALPTDDAGWEKHINKFELGTPERQEAFDQYQSYLEKSHGQKL